MRGGRDAIAKGMLALLGICVAFLAAESSFRLYQRVRYDVPLRPGPADLPRYIENGRGTRLSSIMLDDRLGWRATPGYRFEGPRRNADGSSYDVSVSFDRRGFRLFGDPESRRPRILVTGDSFTQAVEASDGRAYYALMQGPLDAEMFVYGVGGYGTLQEYMSLDGYLEQIRPDLVLWQYCSNDVMNNLPELERRSLFSNNGLVRPYWVDGRVEYLLPKPDPLGVRTLAVRHSRLAYWMLSRWDIARARTSGASEGVEREIGELGFDHEGFREAVAVTDELMARVRGSLGIIPIVAFSCDDRWPYHQAFEEISRRNDIVFVREVGRAIDEAEGLGEVVKVEDGHWNERGHRIAAEALLAAIRQAGLAAR